MPKGRFLFLQEFCDKISILESLGNWWTVIWEPWSAKTECCCWYGFGFGIRCSSFVNISFAKKNLLPFYHIFTQNIKKNYNHGDASIFPDLSFRQTNSAQYIFSLHNMFRHSGPDHVLHSTGKFDKYFSSTFQISESEISVKNRLDNRNTKKWK